MAASGATAPPLARGDAGALRLRTLSAAVMAPVALAAVWLGGAALAVLVALAGAGMAWEWARLTGRGAVAGAAFTMMAAVLAAVVVTALGGMGPALALVLALLGGAAAGFVARASAPVWAAAGSWWITVPCIAFLWLAAAPGTGRPAALWLLATVWASDSGAYAAGRVIGGPRLAPRLSPNKTWAGLAGGLAAAGLIGAAAAAWAGVSPVRLVATGIALGLAAQAGDLVESLAKRRFGVKDTGQLIPGHGGLLDRLDGMLAATLLLAAITLLRGASPLA